MSQQPGDNGKKILVIDDEEHIRYMLSEALHFEGYDVQTAEDGLKGLELFRKNLSFGVVLTDLLMPEMNGMDFLEKARELDPYVEVILLTGFGSNETIVDALKKGAFDYLQKPTNIEELFFTVKKAFERRNLYEQNQKHQKKLEKLVAELAVRNSELESTLRQLHETQSQLIQSEKLASLGQLAAGIAHEINNPLGFVHSNLGSLKKYADRIKNVLDYVITEVDTLEDKQILGNIQKTWNKNKLDFILPDLVNVLNESLDGTQRVRTIVQDLKNFSNLDRAQISNANLANALDSTLNIARNEIKYKADVVKEYEDIPNVRCNLQQINQVMLNMLVNAGHAITQERGIITIRLKNYDSENVSIEIEDNGSGIEKEVLSKIFDPFFTTKDVGSGTGLGLSISYRIIKEHNGEIKVDTEVGKGTKFTIILPIEGPDLIKTEN